MLDPWVNIFLTCKRFGCWLDRLSREKRSGLSIVFRVFWVHSPLVSSTVNAMRNDLQWERSTPSLLAKIITAGSRDSLRLDEVIVDHCLKARANRCDCTPQRPRTDQVKELRKPLGNAGLQGPVI